MPRLLARALVAGTFACALAGVAGGPAARACMIDKKPTVSADGVLARTNNQLPTTANFAVWASFIFPRAFAAHKPVALSENRAQIAGVLQPTAMRRPWRWRITDGTNRAGGRAVLYGWTVRHAFAHPGQWQIDVDCFDTITKRWYPFDQVALVVHR